MFAVSEAFSAVASAALAFLRIRVKRARQRQSSSARGHAAGQRAGLPCTLRPPEERMGKPRIFPGAVRAAKEATSTIPIVMAVSAYPDKIGVVESLAQPGGNATLTAHNRRKETAQ